MNQDVGGHLIKVQPLLAACAGSPGSVACLDLLKALHNPDDVGDQPAGTQTVGWVDAWMSASSVYAVRVSISGYASVHAIPCCRAFSICTTIH